jgi:hypothetical protein
MITLNNNELFRRLKTSAKLLYFTASMAVISLNGSAVAATSILQFGITWTFSEDKAVGQYANGDWWVVGPVTITSISPASMTDGSGWTKNGTMLNPSPTTRNLGQGFDSSVNFGTYYNSFLNVAPAKTGSPLVVPGGVSVVSSISAGSPNTVVARSQFEIQAFLTVVAVAPPAGAFRPPPTGSDKTHYWNKSSLNYGILQSLATPASTLPLSTVEGYFEKPWPVIAEGASIQAMSPKQMPNYGRDAANLLNHGLLSLHLNYTNSQKDKLYIKMVQYGIDIYGSVKAGMVFTDNGGLNNGRKAPMVFAGMALSDPNILEWSDRNQHNVFGEDKQTFYVSQSDVSRARYTADGRPRDPYTQAMIGTPEWGEKHESQPERDGSNWGAYYRWIGGSQLGNVLAIRLSSGGVSAWNHQALFDYEDRYWELEKNAQTYSAPNNISSFTYEMWAAYRNSGSVVVPPPTTAVGTFSVGDRISASENTNIRATAALSGSLLGVQTLGALGTIVSGPVVADNIIWWQMNFDNGVDGWGGADNFSKSTTAVPPAPVVNFTIGIRIETVKITNVRASGALSGTLLGVQTKGSPGTIVSGPIVADNITWWQVNFDSGTDGWSGGDNFITSTNQTLPPTVPTGLKVVK